MEQVKKHIFWIIIGVLLVIAIVASFVITGPVRTENEAMVRSLEERIVMLKKYASDCKNDAWIKSAEQQQKLIAQEAKACDKFYLQYIFDEMFNTDPALWKDKYKEELSLLVESLKSAQVLVGADTLHSRLAVWGDRVPTRPEMEVANREFWVLKDMCDLVLKLKDEQDRVRVYRVVQIGFPGVAEYRQVEFDPEEGAGKITEEQLKRKVIRDTYQPVPVVAILDLDSKYLERFLGEILTSPWRYNIQTCDVIRKPAKSGKEGFGLGPEEERAKKQELPKARRDIFENTTVRVRLYLEALDFTPLKAALQKKAAEGENNEG